MNRRQWLTIIAISFFALIAGVFSSHWINQPQLANELAIQHFLSHDWQDPDGKPANSADWKGKLLVVNFWASWCPPCVEEMPALSRIQTEFKQQNVLFVGIGIDSPSNIREFLKKTPVTYPIVIGGMDGSNISKEMGNTQGALPFTIVINSQGKAVSSKLGKISEDELRSMIKANL